MTKRNIYSFILLFIISFVYRLIFILVFQFDGLYGQDAYTYYDNSAAVFESLGNFQAPPNFYWPIGYPLIVSIFTLFTLGNIGLAGLLVSMNAGALIPGVVFLLTYEILRFGKDDRLTNVPLYAGIITCFSGIIVKSSIVIMSDALGLLFVCLCMLFLVKYSKARRLRAEAETPRRKYIVLSFIFLALAIMTRYACVIMLIPFVIYSVYLIRVDVRNRAAIAKHYGFAIAAGFVVFLPQLYYILKYGIAYLPGEPEQQTWVMKWSPANFFIKDFMTKDGTMHYRLWNGLYYLSPVFHPLCLSLFGFAFIYGVISLLKRKHFQILSFCLLWVLFFYIYLAGSPYQSIRYTMSFLPALIIVSAIGLGSAARNLRQSTSDKSVLNADKAVKVFILIAIAAMTIYTVYHLDGFAGQKRKDLEVVHWVDSNIPAGSELFAFEITSAINHYTRTKPNEFYFFDEAELKNKIDSASSNVYFILPEEKLQTQWLGLPIQRTFQFLKNNYNLSLAVKLNYYKVYVLVK